MSALYFDARIDGAKLQQDIANINRQLGRITQTVKKEGDEIDSLTRRMGAGLKTAFGVGGLFAGGAFIKDIARVRGEFQQLEVAFETMLGNKDKADKLMAQVVDFAAKTPFELTDVAGGAKQLLAYGTAADDIIPTLKALGDVSAGLSVPIERLILNYGQVRTQLKLTGRELRDFQVAGVPIVAELSKQIGVSEQKIQEMVTAGEIGFDKVEAAFKSMTSEGGRFNDLMDKQAKTITGLASNFADAWDRMLNSIGKQNEGIIANVIKGATEVVDNYEEVLKVLGILIVTYGTYKAAVIATSVATRLSTTYGVFDIATKKLQTAATLKAAAAQTALNVAASVNPYIAIATAVAALIALLVTYGKETKKAEDYVNELNDTASKLGEQTKVDDLIKKYDELKNKANKTEAEQAELNATISELAKLFPETITGINNYGNAIDITREKLVALNEEQRKYLEREAKSTLEESQKKRNELLEKQGKIQKEIETKRSDATLSEWSMVGQSLDEKQIKQKIIDYNVLTKQISDLGITIAKTQSELFQVKDEDAEKFKSRYKELFGDVSKMTVATAEETKNSLEKLLSYQNSPEIAEAIEKQITALRTQITSPTVKQQIAQAKKELDEAKAILEGMQKSDSIATDPQRAEQKAIVDNLQKIYDERRNANDKEAAKALEEQEKLKDEKLKADQDYAYARLSLERSLQASIIATQQQGAERQIAEAELAFQQEKDNINKREKEFKDSFKGKYGTDDFAKMSKDQAKEMTDALAAFDKERVNAETVKNDKVVKINEDAAARIQEIWDAVIYSSDYEREIADINKKYDALEKEAKKHGATLVQIALLNSQRVKEINDATSEYETSIAYAKIDLEEQIAARKNSIQLEGFTSELTMMKKNFDAYKKFQKEKIALLNQSSKQEDKDQADLLTAELNAEELNFQIDAYKKIAAEVLGFMTSITGELEKQGYLTQEETEYLNKWATAIMEGKVAKMAISEAMASIIRTFPESASSKYAEQIERINQALKEQQRLIEQAKRAGGMQEALQAELEILRKQNKTLEQQLEDAKDKLEGTWLGKLSPFYNTRVESVNELTLAVKESQNAIEDAELALKDYLAGGVTQNTIADVIAEGFQSGKTSVDDFAEYMNDVLLDAVMNIFKAEILGPEIDALSEYVRDSLSDNNLTESEKAEIDRRTKEIADRNKLLWEQLTGALDIPGTEANKPQGLTGAIKGITEESAGLIAGQFFAMREIGQKTYMTGLEQLDGINRSVGFLEQIANNTKHNSKLNEIAETLANMNTKIQNDL